MSEQKVLQVTVDATRCQGHNRCKAIAPQLFDLDEFGHARVVGDGTVPDGLREKARLAVVNCPEFAIRATQRSSGERL
jgi:ferredoxin